MLVGDLAATHAFWTKAIGLEVLVEDPGYLRVGGGDGFNLGIEEGDPGPAGSLELNVLVDDVDRLYEALIRLGVSVEGPPQDQPWGARHCWLHDPDGRRISIYSVGTG